MANTLGKFAFAEETFAAAHILSTLFNLVDDVFNTGNATYLVSLNGIVELLQAELNVVEVFDSLAQLFGNVGQHGLEVAKRLAYNLRAFGGYTALWYCIGNEYHDAPILVVEDVVVLAVFAGNELEYFAVDVISMLSFKLFANVGGNSNDVVHQHVNVGENRVVDVLQNVVRGISLGCCYLIGSVDKTIA